MSKQFPASIKLIDFSGGPVMPPVSTQPPIVHPRPGGYPWRAARRRPMRRTRQQQRLATYNQQMKLYCERKFGLQPSSFSVQPANNLSGLAGCGCESGAAPANGSTFKLDKDTKIILLIGAVALLVGAVKKGR